MNRSIVVAVVVLSSGCAHRAVQAVSTAPIVNETKAKLSAPPSVDAVAEVEAALSKLTLKFGFDQDLLAPEGMTSLQKLAPVLRRHSDVRVTIAGNCDERGTEEYNLLLGQRRAESARKYLAVLGVEEQQLETISFGAERPLSWLHDEEAWADNRRDDVGVKSQLSFSDEPLEALP